MPRKGMRSIFFSSSKPRSSSSSSSSSSSVPASPAATPSSLLFTESLMDDNVASAGEIIQKWDEQPSPAFPLFSDNRREAREFLRAVRGLQEAMKFYITRDSTSHKLVRAQTLMQAAMRRLEREFHRILADNRDRLDPESVSGRSSNNTTVSSLSELLDGEEYDAASDFDDVAYIDVAGESIREVERVSSLAMSDLRLIAEAMISSGYGKECVDIYKTMRKSIVDEGLYRLGFEKMTGHQLQKLGWDFLENKIKVWLHAFKIAVKTLFPGERILCDHVFASSAAIRESCFSDITRNAAVDLLAFAELVATKCKKSPERMFRFLDIYDAVAELWPEIESVFSFDSTAAVGAQAGTSIARLADAIRAMLSDFEAAIQKDSSKRSIPGGGIHPLTKYVMNFLGFLADYSVCLADIYVDLPPPTRTSLPETLFLDSNSSSFSSDNPTSSVLVRLAWLILVLLCKLDSKAELYKDVGLAYLFLSNNLQYVVGKVRSSDLRHLLGLEWLAKYEEKVRLYATNYERVAWSKVNSALPEDPAEEMSPEAAKVAFRRFNAAFEEATRRHSGWVVPDNRLRDDIKVSVAKSIVPRYREFYIKYRAAVRGMEGVVIRFGPEDVGNYLSDLFYGDEIPAGSMSDSGSAASSVRSRVSR